MAACGAHSGNDAQPSNLCLVHPGLLRTVCMLCCCCWAADRHVDCLFVKQTPVSLGYSGPMAACCAHQGNDAQPSNARLVHSGLLCTVCMLCCCFYAAVMHDDWLFVIQITVGHSHTHVLDVTRRKTSPVWGASDRLIGQRQHQEHTSHSASHSASIPAACGAHPGNDAQPSNACLVPPGLLRTMCMLCCCFVQPIGTLKVCWSHE
jgi:hypothetical protein